VEDSKSGGINSKKISALKLSSEDTTMEEQRRREERLWQRPESSSRTEDSLLETR
jgi:hypothetical protein